MLRTWLEWDMVVSSGDTVEDTDGQASKLTVSDYAMRIWLRCHWTFEVAAL